MQAEGLVAVFFDDREGITYTVRMPLFKDDNWNLGGYFTIASGKRVPIEGWSPQAAQGRGRELIQALLVAGRIDPSLISARRTHERCLGGDGGQHWLPLARQTFRDGQAAYWAYDAARIPTGSAPKGGSPEFERGWREARTVRSVAAGMAVVSNMLAVAGPVATAFRMPQGYALKNDRGRTLTVTWRRGKPGQATYTLAAESAVASRPRSVSTTRPAAARPQPAASASTRANTPASRAITRTPARPSAQQSVPSAPRTGRGAPPPAPSNSRTGGVREGQNLPGNVTPASRTTKSGRITDVQTTSQQQQSGSMPLAAVTVLDQTTNYYKERFFSAFGSINTGNLPLVQQPPPDELEMSTKGNAAAKAQHAAKAELPGPFLLADIAGARGILPPTLVSALHDYVTFGAVDPHVVAGDADNAAVLALNRFLASSSAPPSTEAWWCFLGDMAGTFGQRAAWDALRSQPVLVLTDDSKTQLFIRSQDGGERPLSFRRLDRAVQAMRDDPVHNWSALAELHRAVRAVAATLQATRAHHEVDQGKAPDSPFQSEDSAFDWYLSRLGGHGLLGPDGAPIASLLSPLRLLEGLDQLARTEGLPGLQDLVVRSKSVVSATLLYAPRHRNDATRSWQATGFADFRFPPLDEAIRRLDHGEPIALDHVLVPADGSRRSVEKLVTSAAPEDLRRLPRGKAVEELRNHLNNAGLQLPPVGGRTDLPALGRGDRVAVVVPSQADQTYRAALVSSILAAWRPADRPNQSANTPEVVFYDLESMDDVRVNAAIRSASVRYFVSPDLVPGADGSEAMRHLGLGLLSNAIDATVGPAALRANPSFVLHDPSRASSTGKQIRDFLDDLYLQGEVPHPLPIAFLTDDAAAITAAAQHFWRGTTVRPRTLEVHPRSSPLRTTGSDTTPSLPIVDHQVVTGAPIVAAAGVDSYRPELPPLQVALFGSAAEQPPPGVVASTQRVMTEFIHAVNRVDSGGVERQNHRLVLQGEALDAVARQVLAVARPTTKGEGASLARHDYLRRVEAALRAMPGVDVRQQSDSPEDPVFEIDVPQVRRPVVAVHGAGRSKYPMRTPDDPVRTVMDGFNLVHPIADHEGRIFWVGSRGVTTPELLLLEGTPPPGSPHVFPRPHTQEFARLIVERTALVSRDTQLAFSFAGRMGTRQEELFYRGLLVIVDPNPGSASLDRVIAMRGALGLRTGVLDSGATDIALRMDRIVRFINAQSRAQSDGR